LFFFFQAEDGIRDGHVTGVQTCALPISLKRNRGRRGLDILQRVQKIVTVNVQIVEDDFPAIREVDLKLIELGKMYEAKIMTNDFNLNKVAQLQGVEVLNINELANSLKPIVLPGEIMRVFILKEGKEYNQGVAYLDDGTMVVVDNALKMSYFDLLKPICFRGLIAGVINWRIASKTILNLPSSCFSSSSIFLDNSEFAASTCLRRTNARMISIFDLLASNLHYSSFHRP